MDNSQLNQISIAELNLSVRTSNSLRRAGVQTLGELLDVYNQDRLSRVRNLGSKGIEEIKQLIADLPPHKYLEEIAAEEAEPVIEPGPEINQEDTKTAFDEVPVRELHFSGRTENCLKRTGIKTFGELLSVYEQGNLTKIRNLGTKSYNEILEIIESVSNGTFQFEEKTEASTIEEFIVPEELEDIPIADLKLNVRTFNCLANAGVDTVGKLLRMTSSEILSIYGMGIKSADEIKDAINGLKEKGIDYLEILSTEEDSSHKKRVFYGTSNSIDIETVKVLRDRFGFKAVWLAEWFNITRSRIGQILQRRVNYGNWLNKEFTEDDKSLLMAMIEQRESFIQGDDRTRAYFLNNQKDDCVALFERYGEVKCFFLNDLPEDIQSTIREHRLDCLSMEEARIIDRGKIVFISNNEFFCPGDMIQFKKFAYARQMSLNDYCIFLTGKHYAKGHITIAEDINYSEEVEEDMEIYAISESPEWIDKLFAENPLIGNRLLSEKTREKLFSVTKSYIDKRLREPRIKFPLKAKMQIALAVITYAKEWDVGDESGFWRFITSQFGYRDETSQLRGILGNCVYEALTQNHRLFLAGEKGYYYKSTIVIHALTPRRSWMLLFDFLFDFYRTNMEWTYIEDDPIVARMVYALRNKLVSRDENDEESLEISTKAYSFQEGIRKLIINRPGYSTELIHRMLHRIDDLINHRNPPVELYVDALCDQWLEERLKSSRDSKKRGETEAKSRKVAIDYTRIRPYYRLIDENKVVISLPDIRLQKTEFSRITLQVWEEESILEERSLSYYGNELGKTLNSFDIDVGKCARQGDGSLHMRVVLLCDEDIIFDSEETLHREWLCFSREKECDIGDCVRGTYSIFTTEKHSFDFSEAEVSEIDTESGWSAYYVKLKKNFIIRTDDQIVSFDNADSQSSGGVKVIYPAAIPEASFVKNGRRYRIVSKEPQITLIVRDQSDLRKCAVVMNSQKSSFEGVDPETTANGLVYTIPLKMSDDHTCDLQVIDLERNRILSRDSVKYLNGFSVHFNRDFYYQEKDYEGAYADVLSSSGLTHLPFNHNDEVLSFARDEGVIEIRIPEVVVRNDAGEKWDDDYTSWIKDIAQNEKIYVTVPAGCILSMNIKDIDLTEETKGCFDFGNAVFSYSGESGTDWLRIQVCVSGNNTEQDYYIGRITPEERFAGEVVFDYHDDALFWNRGQGFIGKADAAIKLRLETEADSWEYPLDMEDNLVIDKPDLPIDEYHYQIVKESENIFFGDETVLCQGTLLIGDKNELRFRNHMIEITNITYEEDGNPYSVDIKYTYIDHIKYQGIQYVNSEERECPVYTGEMFYMGQSAKHHYFSFEEAETEKGHLLYSVNPVRIVYINEHTLSITNQDGDGIYYYRFFDKKAMANHYAITDREPVSRNQSNYHLADLYTYRKERII
ncbi:MAG: hypothetical protein IKF90_07835 [Parasporobacterium sp.]|nr:hypothetical protein [Parasporobacterium sp.]